MRPITTKILFSFISISLLIAVLISMTISSRLSLKLNEYIQTNFISLVFDSIAAGPVSFARLHSSEIANEQLRMLMATPALSERGVVSARIVGGPMKSDIFAHWVSDSSLDDKCLYRRSRDIEFRDAINPFTIEIEINKCRASPESKIVKKYATLAAGSVLFIVALLLMFALWPLLSDISKAQHILEGAGNIKMNKLFLAPMVDLVNRSIRATELELESKMLQLSRQIAHDIRSPLSALNMLVASMQDSQPERRDLLKSVIKRINDIADGLLKSTSSERNRIEIVDLKRICEQIVQEKKAQYSLTKNIQFRLNYSATNFPVKSKIATADILRVLSNIINNSVESICSNDGFVELTLSTRDDQALIEIKDNGTGIPKELISKLGRKEVSLKEPGKNHGLGLAHAFKTIQSYGGNIEIQSELGCGTIVSLRLPIAK